MSSYNLPWAGRFGRIASCCLVCGDGGPEFQLSSAATHCLRSECYNKEPDPELYRHFQARYEQKARAWCDERNIDYDATIAMHEANKDLITTETQNNGTFIVYKK